MKTHKINPTVSLGTQWHSHTSVAVTSGCPASTPRPSPAQHPSCPLTTSLWLPLKLSAQAPQASGVPWGVLCMGCFQRHSPVSFRVTVWWQCVLSPQ